MAFKIDITQYQLNLYSKGYEFDDDEKHVLGDNSPFQNPSLFIVAADSNGKPADCNDPVTTPVVGTPYFLGALVKNTGDTTTIKEMRFNFPTWVGEDNVKVKDIDFNNKDSLIRRNREKCLFSRESIVFLHAGNYEMSAEIKFWDPNDNDFNAPPSEWPTSGSLYGRTSIKVQN